MILDNDLYLASALASTLSAASTDYIDTKAQGNDYKGCIFAVQVSTTFTASGQPTVQFLLQTSSTPTFTGPTTETMAISATMSVSALTAGQIWHVVIPAGAKRYIRGFQLVVSTGTVFFTGGAVNMFICKDIDVDIDKRYLMTRLAKGA